MTSHRTSYRWAVLAIYAWLAGLSQLLWLNFAPILSFVQRRYGVSESVASLLLLVFPLTYVLLSVHAGALIDRRGYRFAIGIGALMMAVFSCLRIADGGFWLLLVAQTGISLGQPYIVNGVTKLVMDWFPPEETVLATGLGTVGLFVGMAIGMAVTPPLIEAVGYTGSMALFAGVTSVSALAFMLICRTRSGMASMNASGNSSAAIEHGFWRRFLERELLLLFAISFLGLGYFNGLTSWIEAILATHGIDSARAGIIGGILIVGGIAGSILIPALSDRFRRRKPFLILSITAACLTLIPLCRSSDYRILLLFGFLQGFFFLPAYALLLDMTSIQAGQRWAGSATGVLMMVGNAGGVVAIFLMGWLKGEGATFPSALSFLICILALSGGVSLLATEPRSDGRALSTE